MVLCIASEGVADFHLQRLFFERLTDTQLNLLFSQPGMLHKAATHLRLKMEQIIPMETQLSVYLQSMDSQFVSEKAVLVEIYQDLSSRKAVVGNKDIIHSLLEKLESENDVIKLDVYRQALEMVVQLTPDDTIN